MKQILAAALFLVVFASPAFAAHKHFHNTTHHPVVHHPSAHHPKPHHASSHHHA
ncbi:MAG: hypothetical protein ABR905_10570 [Terracidiphilus sp.]|jgi:hypothetical protein